jgi:hypothetical protein
MLALAVDAGVGGRVLGSGACPGVVIFSTKATSSLTFTPLCSVPVAPTDEAKCHHAVFNEGHTVMELPFMP